jgi:cell division protein FtsN
VIKANEQPTKIPGTPTAREPASRTTFDRADRNAPERMVTREEVPVDIQRPTPRVVGSSPAPMAVGQTTGSLSAPSTGATPGAPTEAKKVKTIPIRPDNSAGPRSDTKPAPTRTASIAPVVASTAPAAPAAASTGGHVVQVSSQKSESDAQASFRALQSKYPTVLAGRAPLIRKAELGDRGTVYRVQVGPFASADKANELCTNLKTAGGQCIVQRN